MVLLIGSTGLRRSEMIALTWSDLNTRTIEFKVLSLASGTGKVRQTPSHREVQFRFIQLS